MTSLWHITKGLFGRLTSFNEKQTLSAVQNEEVESAVKELFPAGHFYSPIPNLLEVRKDENLIWDVPEKIEGINLNEKEQLKLLQAFAKYYKELPFRDQKHEKIRYYFQNPAFSYSDAIVLYSMIRFAKPKNIIEVGSGYSSCVTLDTNDLFFDGHIRTTFIEPYPGLLYSLINNVDKEKIRVLPIRLQDVPLDEFDFLEKNDILFIDSTHVSKVNSDVNYLIFKVLPRLKSGVIVHFHDIFYPFEYPKIWIYEGRAWNESYVLRAFLEYNNAFKILYFNNYLGQFYLDQINKYMPLCLKNIGGSIWLQKK